MKNIEGPINGICICAHEVVMNNAATYRSLGQNGQVLMVEDFLLVIYLSFRTVLVLVVLLGKAPAKQATATAMEHGLIPVLAKVPGNIFLVGIKVYDNHRLAEGGG
jgi:hypothetical protein